MIDDILHTLTWTAIIGVVLTAPAAISTAVVRLAEANPALAVGLLVFVVCIVCLGLADVEPL